MGKAVFVSRYFYHSVPEKKELMHEFVPRIFWLYSSFEAKNKHRIMNIYLENLEFFLVGAGNQLKMLVPLNFHLKYVSNNVASSKFIFYDVLC